MLELTIHGAYAVFFLGSTVSGCALMQVNGLHHPLLQNKLHDGVLSAAAFTIGTFCGAPLMGIALGSIVKAPNASAGTALIIPLLFVAGAMLPLGVRELLGNWRKK